MQLTKPENFDSQGSGVKIDEAKFTPANSQVYNLTVLVLQTESGDMQARAANMELAQIEAASIRDALSQMVSAARRLIAEHLGNQSPIPWIDPPAEASESESSFMVPLHL